MSWPPMDAHCSSTLLISDPIHPSGNAALLLRTSSDAGFRSTLRFLSPNKNAEVPTCVCDISCSKPKQTVRYQTRYIATSWSLPESMSR